MAFCEDDDVCGLLGWLVSGLLAGASERRWVCAWRKMGEEVATAKLVRKGMTFECRLELEDGIGCSMSW